jgi:hypothetical protein
LKQAELGISDEKALYKRLITTADRRFDAHLGNLPK